MEMDKSVIYAAGYYPLMHEKEDWEKDLKTMKDMGIRLIRTAELFNTWDRIEPEKGVFNFGFLDEFFDLCAKFGIKILLGTGTASPPYWLHEMYPDVNILNNHNEQYPNNVSYTWACMDNPGYIEECERYIKVLVNRYKDHAALHSYQIHNEIGFPFMPLKSGDVDLYCYCDHSVKNFRDWVKEKYKTLDALNYAYRWGATNTCQTSWEQIVPPKTKPSSWSSVTRWLDWRLYWMDTIVNFVKWQNDLIKTMDTVHLTTTNIFFLKSQDPLGVLTGLDQFEMAKVVDIVGFDLYPGSGDKLEKRPEFASMFLDMSRSTAECLGRDYWILETESGPINGWVLGPSRNVKGFDLIRNVFEAIGHDSKLTLYQGFREWDFQPLHWGAIVDLDGNPTERTASANKIGKIINENNELLFNAKTPKSKVALLISKENAIVLNGMGQEEFLIKALRGAYTYFWQNDYKVDFISPEQVENGYCNNYDLIYMPFMAVVDDKLASGLAKYVEQGGNLVGTARCGMLGDKGWYNHQIPCHSLQDVFGISSYDANAGENANVTYKMKNYAGHWHREEIDVLSSNASVLARFNNDKPAITMNTYGEGKAIYFGTHPDVGYLENNSDLLHNVLGDFMQDENIVPAIELDYTNRCVKEIDAHYLSTDKEGLLIVTNYVQKSHGGFFAGGEKKVRVAINADKKYTKAIDIDTNEEIASVDNNKFEITVKRNQTMILRLQ